jgi:CheY-like chemotaxis protein
MPARPVVLVVDDTLDHLDLYEMALSEHYTILRATSGATALEAACAERPDAILLDVMLPGDDGFVTCKRLKQHPITADIPVVLFTASDGVETEARAILAGAIQLLHKPCSAERLSLTIDAAIQTGRSMDDSGRAPDPSA